MLESQESDPFVAEPTDKDLLVPEATLAALRAGSPVPAGSADAVDIDTLHAKGLQAVERLSVEDCVQLLRRCVGWGGCCCLLASCGWGSEVFGEEGLYQVTLIPW